MKRSRNGTNPIGPCAFGGRKIYAGGWRGSIRGAVAAANKNDGPSLWLALSRRSYRFGLSESLHIRARVKCVCVCVCFIYFFFFLPRWLCLERGRGGESESAALEFADGGDYLVRTVPTYGYGLGV